MGFLYNKFMENFIELGDKFVVVLDIIGKDAFLLIGLIAAIFVIFGWKDAKKIVAICPVAYLLFKIFMWGFFGV